MCILIIFILKHIDKQKHHIFVIIFIFTCFSCLSLRISQIFNENNCNFTDHPCGHFTLFKEHLCSCWSSLKNTRQRSTLSNKNKCKERKPLPTLVRVHQIVRMYSCGKIHRRDDKGVRSLPFIFIRLLCRAFFKEHQQEHRCSLKSVYYSHTGSNKN